jgi:hypothetical protein
MILDLSILELEQLHRFVHATSPRKERTCSKHVAELAHEDSYEVLNELGLRCRLRSFE